MRIAVFGAGGVGGLFGARLVEAGHEVALLARGPHLQAIRAGGLRVESEAGVSVVHPALATDDPAEVGPVDAVLVAVKTWQLPEAAAALGPLLGEGTSVLPLQNGVEARGVIAAAVGPERVLEGLCGTLTWVEAPGRIRSLGDQHFVKLGEADDRRTARVERLRAAFDEAGVSVEVPPSIRVALWEKFLFVVPVGGVGAVARAPLGVTRSVPATRDLIDRAAAEIHAVGRASGVPIPDDALRRAGALLDRLDPRGTSSLQRDLAEGRRSELDAWNGAVVRLGARAGVPTPVHGFLYAALLPTHLRAMGGLPAGEQVDSP